MPSNDMIPVSTSEVATFGTCERRWMYAHHHSYHLEPAKLGMALSRGLMGHKALEFFYTQYLKCADYDQAANETLNRLTKESLRLMLLDPEQGTMVAKLANRLQLYFQTHKWDVKHWEIIGVEQYIEAPLPGLENKAYFAGRVDLVVKHLYGDRKGEISPYDHKFVYNFWNDNVLKINAQFPNYEYGLRYMGHKHIRRSVANQIRWREFKNEPTQEQLWQRPDIPSDPKKAAGILNNHVLIAKRIVRYQEMSGDEVRAEATRSIFKFNCEYCPFARLCDLELRKEDATTAIKADFKPNSYGYADRNDEN